MGSRRPFTNSLRPSGKKKLMTTSSKLARQKNGLDNVRSMAMLVVKELF